MPLPAMSDVLRGSLVALAAQFAKSLDLGERERERESCSEPTNFSDIFGANLNPSFGNALQMSSSSPKLALDKGIYFDQTSQPGLGHQGVILDSAPDGAVTAEACIQSMVQSVAAVVSLVPWQQLLWHLDALNLDDLLTGSFDWP